VGGGGGLVWCVSDISYKLMMGQVCRGGKSWGEDGWFVENYHQKMKSGNGAEDSLSLGNLENL